MSVGDADGRTGQIMMHAVAAGHQGDAGKSPAVGAGRHLLEDGREGHFQEGGTMFEPPQAPLRGGSVWFVTCFTVEDGLITFHSTDSCPLSSAAAHGEGGGSVRAYGGMGGEVAVDGRVLDGQTGDEPSEPSTAKP